MRADRKFGNYRNCNLPSLDYKRKNNLNYSSTRNKYKLGLVEVWRK